MVSNNFKLLVKLKCQLIYKWLLLNNEIMLDSMGSKAFQTRLISTVPAVITTLMYSKSNQAINVTMIMLSLGEICRFQVRAPLTMRSKKFH